MPRYEPEQSAARSRSGANFSLPQQLRTQPALNGQRLNCLNGKCSAYSHSSSACAGGGSPANGSRWKTVSRKSATKKRELFA